MPIADQKSIASILNEYFTSIGSKLANKIRSTFQPKQLPPSTDLSFSFEFEEVDESFVLRQLSSLKTNKATGLDQISAKLLKDSASTIASSSIDFQCIARLTNLPRYLEKRENYSPLQIQ